MKVKDVSTTAAAFHMVDRRVARSADKSNSNHRSNATNNNTNHYCNGYFNLRHRPSPPPTPPPPLRTLRNSENSDAMRGHSNSGLRRVTSPDWDNYNNNKRATNHINGHHDHFNNNYYNNRSKIAASSETAREVNKGGDGASSGSGDAVAPPPPLVWPPKFVIGLTNKEKEEDFFAFKGSKLPQRPKKRAKFIQRTLNLVSPGAWLCDLTLERYEVREKKISKKRPRGLKAMGNMDSDSE